MSAIAYYARIHRKYIEAASVAFSRDKVCGSIRIDAPERGMVCKYCGHGPHWMILFGISFSNEKQARESVCCLPVFSVLGPRRHG